MFRLGLPLIVSLLFTNLGSAYAMEFKSVSFPLVPRALIDGSNSNGDFLFTEGDAMLPLYGNRNEFFFADGFVKAGTEAGRVGSLGGGYRGIHNNYLWGAYAFGDFNRLPKVRSHYFPVINPGLELMTNLIDVHLNGYLPVSSRERVTGVSLAEQLGMTQYISFAGHSQFDNLINVVEEIGKGFDGEIGLTLPETKRIRVFTGGYHFQFKDIKDINGVIGGVEMPINDRFSVLVRDSYDRVQKNTTLITLRLTLGGEKKEAIPEIHDRLLDPIPRHLGTWSTGSGIPSQQHYVNTGTRVQTRGNIWFFSGSGGAFVTANGFANCTFENNCAPGSFTQANVNAINSIAPNANFYLSSGVYDSLLGFGTGTLILNNGQSIYGRTPGFVSGGEALIQGSIMLTGNNNLDHVLLLNKDGEQSTGLFIQGNNNKVSNSIIGAESNELGYRTAVRITNANNVTIENSSLTAFVNNTNDISRTVTGVLAEYSGVVLKNTLISVKATQQTGNPATAQVTALGVVANHSSIGVEAPNLLVSATENDANGQATAIGYLLEASNFNLIRGSNLVFATTTGTNSTAEAIGIRKDIDSDILFLASNFDVSKNGQQGQTIVTQ